MQVEHTSVIFDMNSCGRWETSFFLFIFYVLMQEDPTRDHLMTTVSCITKQALPFMTSGLFVSDAAILLPNNLPFPPQDVSQIKRSLCYSTHRSILCFLCEEIKRTSSVPFPVSCLLLSYVYLQHWSWNTWSPLCQTPPSLSHLRGRCITKQALPGK